MSRPLRIAAAITPHGFGHAAVTLAVLRTLHDLWPGGCDVTFITRVPEAVLRSRWGLPCRVVEHGAATDFGMVMGSSTDVRVPDSLDAYRAAHHSWEAVVEAETAILSAARPDLVVSCISYAALEAARRMGLRCVGLGPFTWHEILQAYGHGYPEAGPILEIMRHAYGGADAIIATTPAVPMTYANARIVGPVGQPGRPRRRELHEALALADGQRVGLLSLGGIAEESPLCRWPEMPGWRWLEATEADALGLSVSDAIASCDVVLTKPGYGTFVEAACAGTPILYRARPDWPETAGMAAWAEQFVPCFCIDNETFSSGRLQDHLHMVVQGDRTPLKEPGGNREAAEIIVETIGKGRRS